jgi:hypothetical protein
MNYFGLIFLGHVWLKGEAGWELVGHIFGDEVIHPKCLNEWIGWPNFFVWLDGRGRMETKFINKIMAHN